MRKDQQRKPNFTLIELLVVIAIIAILAALLLPSLNNARNQGRSIACCNNMHSSGVALQQYANDYNDYMPYTAKIYDAASFKYGESWECQLGRYMSWSKNSGSAVFHCPSRTSATSNPRNSCGYAVYIKMHFGASSDMPWYGKITKVPKPSRTMYLTERDGAKFSVEVEAPFMNEWNVNSIGISNTVSGPHTRLQSWILTAAGNTLQYRFPGLVLTQTTF